MIVTTMVLLALASVPAAFALEPSGNLQDWIPRGPVREVREYLLQDNATEALVQHILFTEQGRVSQVVRYMSDPENPVTQHFLWDGAHNLEQWIAREADGATLWRYQYRYTPEGNLLQETEFDRFDQVAGNRAFLYFRDGDTLRVEESAYDHSGEVLWWMRRVRNSTEKWSVFYPDGRVITEGIRHFDRQGRTIREEELDRAADNGTVTTYEYSQDTLPRMMEHFDSTGTLLRRESFEYDPYGNPVLHQIENAHEERHVTRRYHYRYDQYGNWLHRTSWRIATGGDQLPEIQQATRERRFRYVE